MKKLTFFSASLCLIMAMAAFRASSPATRVVLLISESGFPGVSGESIIADKLAAEGYKVVRPSQTVGNRPEELDRSALEKACRTAKADFALVGNVPVPGRQAFLRLFRVRDARVCSIPTADKNTMRTNDEAMRACAGDITDTLAWFAGRRTLPEVTRG